MADQVVNPAPAVVHGPKVFVYGTLKRGHGNHRLLKGAQYLGRCFVEGNWKMADLGAFPAVIESDEPGIVFGEVYAINTEILMSLDCLEGYPSFYTRSKIDTPWKKAWMYHLNMENRSYTPVSALIDSGCWRPGVEEKEWAKGIANGE